MNSEASGRRDLESFVEMIAGLGDAQGDSRDARTLWPGRLHLARGPQRRIELFIEGDLDSFGSGAVGRALEFGRYRDLNEEREFPAVVVRAGSGDHWHRPMAHLTYEAYEFVLAAPAATNEVLLVHLAPYLDLVVERETLSHDQQAGLTAELLFLESLLNMAERVGVDADAAVASWAGWDSASRDFVGAGLAVEVKASRGEHRLHWVHPMYQLLPDPAEGDERVYVYSVGLATDRSRSFTLLTLLDRILGRVSDVQAEAIVAGLSKYGGIGFDILQRSLYELEPGFFLRLPPALYRVDNLDGILRPESFADGALPSRVSDVRYRVSLENLQPMGEEERLAVLNAFVRPG